MEITPQLPRPAPIPISHSVPRVISSAIARLDYDPGLRVLTVVFRETGAYAYFDVPPEVYDAFLAAPSKGVFFNRHIRDRYAYARLAALRRHIAIMAPPRSHGAPYRRQGAKRSGGAAPRADHSWPPGARAGRRDRRR